MEKSTKQTPLTSKKPAFPTTDDKFKKRSKGPHRDRRPSDIARWLRSYGLCDSHKFD